ncbi:hypothetical protein BDM02DRAFT_2332632 [Thelephora ganbajun]|uniref:Uncharacterized protein n=1 Tax=Thelephora ganbajun TaxID=370292 RepID=A0ACB6ZFL3_THEGA|nr:hypothetical protein BDM02DRAFT_2332632 [Thelephora ganbajun]
MIPRPVEVYAHVPVNFERSSGPWTSTEFRPTYVHLLSLCAALLFCLLLHVVRSLRLSGAGTSPTSSSCGLAVGDKELCEPPEESQLLEKSAPQSLSGSVPRRGWWWVDALLGRDAEEEEAVANAAHSMVVHTHHQLAWPVQDDPVLQGHRNSILYYQPRQQRPPISMAKLIMSRHAHPPRRPRSPPKPTATTATTTQPQSRPSSRLASSYVQLV